MSTNSTRRPTTDSIVSQGFPEPIAVRFDRSTRRADAGRTLIGGAPLRVLRFSDVGARVVDLLATGTPVGPDAVDQAVARRLVDSGLAHPVPPATVAADVAVVVPVRDDAASVSRLLDDLARDRAAGAVVEIVVVDDGSTDGATLAAAVGDRARLMRHDRSRGPGAARDTGWRETTAPFVAFVDADVHLGPGWLDALHAHFTDPSVGAVAPRVEARARGGSVLDRYERLRSPLDLGTEPAQVRPGGRVSYVPTAALLVRRQVLDDVGGFDESMRFGEDVDLVWRAIEAGHRVRYEPAVSVTHDNRSSWPALCRQRFQYGSSAGALEVRHPGRVSPVDVNAWSLVAWAAVAAGGRRGAALGGAVAAVSAARLTPALRGKVEDPVRETARLAGLGHLWAGRWLASAVTRAWLPAALAASVPSRRIRRATAAAVVVPALIDWVEVRRTGQGSDLDPARWLAARVVDDAAYCAGVWRGCVAARTWRPLRPRLRGIPGLTDRA